MGSYPQGGRGIRFYSFEVCRILSTAWYSHRLTLAWSKMDRLPLDLEIMTNRRIRPTVSREAVMQCNKGKRTLPLLVRGFAALAALAMVAAGSASAAPTETVLYSFAGGSDGANPFAGLVADSGGNLYGATVNGGAAGKGCGRSGCGVVFKLSRGGTETVLHSFTGFRFTGRRHGVHPVAGLIADSSGNLYGTTQNGGWSD